MSNEAREREQHEIPPGILQLFLKLRDHLYTQDVDGLNDTKRKLESAVDATAAGGGGGSAPFAVPSSPRVVMKMLAPCLFRPGTRPSSGEGASADSDGRGGTLSNDDALAIVGFLVASDPSKYLKPASVAVRDEAARLAATPTPRDMYASPSLLRTLVSQLTANTEADDVSVSTNAAEAIAACCRKLGPGEAFGEPCLRAIAEAWRNAWNGGTSRTRSEASTIAVRCASAIVDIICLDDPFMTAAKSCGDINLLLTMLTDESDPLLEMSTLDLIERMATTKPMHYERAKWLLSTDVVVPLLQMAGGTEQGEPDPIMGGPALRVIAALCKLISSQQQDSEGLFHNLASDVSMDLLKGFHLALHNFEISGELDRLAIVDAVSSFASSSSDALDLVLSDPVTKQAWLSLNVAQPKLKASILGSVSLVLDPPNSDATRPSNQMRMKLFSMLGQANNEQPAELAFSLAKSPVVETRLAAYTLMKAVAKIPTGGQVLMMCPGLFEFLINRDIEKTKEGKEGKYSVVQALVNSEVRGLLSDDIVRQLEKYIKDGPHYVKSMQWDIATE